MSASRWIINFHDWTEERAKSYPECYQQVLLRVKPERMKVTFSKSARERWWQFLAPRPNIARAIAGLDRVIVIARVSKTVMPVMVPTGQVMNEMTVVLASDDIALMAVLSSFVHYWWAVTQSSTMKSDLRYAPSAVFETLVRPGRTTQARELGARLDSYRRELMLARQAGLTRTYNLVHDTRCTDADIVELREIHRQIDYAVAHAYGWDELELEHGFHETRQGIRYTVGPVARQEILDLLLELNHERYATEVAAGLQKTTKKASSTETRLF